MPLLVKAKAYLARLFGAAILFALLFPRARAVESAPVIVPIASSPLALVRVTDTSIWNPPSPDPVGIAYHPGWGTLLVSDSEVSETPLFQGTNLYETATDGSLLAARDATCFSLEPTGVWINPHDGHIFFTDDNKDLVFELDLGGDGQLCTSDDILTSFDTRAFGSLDPEGIAFGQGKLFIADGEGKTVYVLSPGDNEVFDGVSPGDDLVLNQFGTEALGLSNPKGIEYHLERHSLFFVSRYDDILVETTPEGVLLKQYDFSFAGVVDPSGLAFGPNSQDPDKISLYLTDRGVDNDSHPGENDGQLFEFTLPRMIYLPVVKK